MMENKKRVELDLDVLDKVAGGAIGFNPDGKGTYTMICEFSGERFYNVRLDQIMEIAKFGSNIPNNAEGEQKIITWARDRGII